MVVAVLLNLPKPGKASCCWAGSWRGRVDCRPESAGVGEGSALLPDMRLRLLRALVREEVLSLLPPGS